MRKEEQRAARLVSELMCVVVVVVVVAAAAAEEEVVVFHCACHTLPAFQYHAGKSTRHHLLAPFSDSQP